MLRKILKNPNKIAILLGVYNAEKYIEEQLRSIMCQTINDFTVYVRDDASQDNTLLIMNRFIENSDNIVLINDDLGNLGCNGNYFHLLSIIDSKYYMFCNADDYWINNKIELSMIEIEKAEKEYPDLPIIIHTDLAITDQNLNIIYNSLWSYDNLNPKLFQSFNEIGVYNTVAGATMLFNQKVKDLTFPVNQYAPFFDHWMSLQTIKNGGILIPIYKSLVYYRQIGTNLALLNIGAKNTIKYKIRNFKDVYKANIKQAIMLKRIGWGGYIKYLFYKIKIFSTLRLIRRKAP